MDRVIRDRIVFFIFAVDFFLLVGLLSIVGWLDPIVRFLGAIFKLALHGVFLFI